jgi:outer membrane protein OmpA-like peptidoglycan-associated protein
MNMARSFALLIMIAAGGLGAACAAVRVQIPERPGQTLVVLLPDGDTNTSGRALVSNTKGATGLGSPHDASVVFANTPPLPPTTLSEAETRRIFGEALSALPPPSQRFTLYFRFESNELTDESRSTVRAILHAIKNHAVPELLVIGHTDSTGSKAANLALGLKRAEIVRLYLISAGVDPSTIAVTSHGETDPLISTADGVFEPRNRRVDISVR